MGGKSDTYIHLINTSHSLFPPHCPPVVCLLTGAEFRHTSLESPVPINITQVMLTHSYSFQVRHSLIFWQFRSNSFYKKVFLFIVTKCNPCLKLPLNFYKIPIPRMSRAPRGLKYLVLYVLLIVNILKTKKFTLFAIEVNCNRAIRLLVMVQLCSKFLFSSGILLGWIAFIK